MEEKNLIEKFERMNTRVKIHSFRRSIFSNDSGNISLDVRRDKKGEFFDIAIATPEELKNVEILDVQPKEKHLLLLYRNNEQKRKDKYLLGHDERHLFVAAVPGEGAKSVETAKRALIPPELKNAVGLTRTKEELKRKNKIFRRTGEWFFVPENIDPDPLLILKNEPLQRNSRSKPHYLEFAYRRGGETRYFPGISRSKKITLQQRRDGVVGSVYKNLPKDVRESTNWDVRVVNPELYAKGRITHGDHKTVILESWHRVYMNGEYLAPAHKHLTFID